MKKFYCFICILFISSASFSQYKAGNNYTTNQIKNQTFKVIKTTHDKATGDSLMYFDSKSFYLMNASDAADFVLENADIDGNTDYGDASWPTPSGDAFQYSFFDDSPLETPYTIPGGNFFPNDITTGTDSAYYISASSWFNSGSLQANNWWSFGPVTIPANTSNNTFNWHDKHHPKWTDAYDVFLVSITNITDTANPQGTVDVTAAGLTPNYSKAQISNLPNGPDTSWTLHSLNIDAFVGQRMFVFFNHNANDGDVLQLDEMYVLKGNPVGLKELNNVGFNVYPNPSTGKFNINLTSNGIRNINLSVKNIVGQTIISKTAVISEKSVETISLADYSKGVYFLTIDNKTVKLIVR
ncbi:MAG: hypothetical protein COA97_00255 [Flavobacteriales bacterium]|nr:MAG: hypothetical protein COA97_00255 [Flavobacteriales bacterium]